MNGSVRRPIPWVPLLLGVFALLDLRVEVQLLLEHFTWSSLAQIPLHHPLAVAVLLLLPSLLRPTR
ncbi:MAG: hypothetical protein EB136_07255 [Synechococcaceae bacterium WBB_3_034]|jgi:hypothetical protein|nr:hypothetical protein [Synechococcaceae bacterium WBB_3_034]